jgi:hemoglobin
MDTARTSRPSVLFEYSMARAPVGMIGRNWPPPARATIIRLLARDAGSPDTRPRLVAFSQMEGALTMDRESIPTLFEWAGGMPALERLTVAFYERVRVHELLGPLFARMDAHHPHFVAQFLAEVLGGPDVYSRTRGGHPRMITQHLRRHLHDAQRKAWMNLLLETADDVGLPSDPEFRSALVAYLEWGTRLAVINSQEGAVVDPKAPVPTWGWGVPGGPYRP